MIIELFYKEINSFARIKNFKIEMINNRYILTYKNNKKVYLDMNFVNEFLENIQYSISHLKTKNSCYQIDRSAKYLYVKFSNTEEIWLSNLEHDFTFVNDLIWEFLKKAKQNIIKKEYS